MALRPVYVLLISLLLYEHASGDYCQNENKPSTSFCQNGTISGSKVYINGSHVKTLEDLKDRGCVCYLEYVGEKEILMDPKDSCYFCGLKVRVGNSLLRSNYYGSQAYGWKLIPLNDANVTMTLELDETGGSLNTAFCITIQENNPDIPGVLTITCEDNAIGYSTASSTSPNVITKSQNITESSTSSFTSPNVIATSPKITESSTASSTSPNVIATSPNITSTKSQSPTSAETPISHLKTETTINAEVSAVNTNVSHGPKANNTCTVTTITTTANDPGETRFRTQKEVIIPAAAGGGAGVLVILVIFIVVCCLRKKRHDAENPIYMKELETSDVIMTANTAYGISIDTNTNSVPHIQAHCTGDVYAVVNNELPSTEVLCMTDNTAYGISIDTDTNSVPHMQAHCTGDVYAVVNKEGTSNVFPSAKVPRMQVGETGDVYAIVNKESVREIPNIENSREKSAKSLLQTRSDKNNVRFAITPSTDYADITTDSDL